MGLSGLGSDGIEGILCIPQSSSITGTSVCLVSYPEHLLVESYPTTEVQLVYSTAPADWATFPKGISLKVYVIIWADFELIHFEAAVQHFSHYSRCHVFTTKMAGTKKRRKDKWIMLFIELATVVKGNLKVPFQLAIILTYREGHYSIHSIAPLFPWYIPYNAEC